MYHIELKGLTAQAERTVVCQYRACVMVYNIAKETSQGVSTIVSYETGKQSEIAFAQ